MATKKHNHHPGRLKGVPWLVCRHCGLVYLRNALTQWCIDRGCDYSDDPGYRTAIRNLTGGNTQ